MQPNDPSTELLMMFHTLTTYPIFVLTQNLNEIITRYPINTPAPSAAYLEKINHANDSNEDYQLFIIQQANLLGLIRTNDRYLLIWNQPLPLYAVHQAHYNLYDSTQFIPKMIAVIKQMAFNLTHQLPATKSIKITSLNLAMPTSSWQSNTVVPSHNSNNAEQKMMAAIGEGNVTAFKSSYHAFISSGEPGLLNINNSIRNQKNLVIVATTIFTRAALHSQLMPEKAYQLSDHYIQGVEQLKQIDDLYNYILNIGLSFIHEVQTVERANVLPVITKVQDYIIKHLHQDLTIPQIANAVEVSPSYLMKLFKNSQGMTIGAYISHQRINEAKSLLKYSSDSLADISAHLGYSTQAYFSRRFSQVTGIAPSNYRTKHQNRFL